ncbi:hypothetical protein QJ856_gp1099 [Tupanvirus deep ocean]|uniref:Uncharacterized protein n=2 Tax=Tupanvirus TaxID=2094720 RepID=A0AC62A7K1_9VIRU|nr:hypothetical protein QJ856_gp1099 [Tupanvirus deep ocean]QKU33658.1 hypothetical protein [Tupanvirus deep ocean]
MANTNFQTIDKSGMSYVMGPLLENKSFRGIDLQLIRGDTLEKCQESCLNNDKCLYVNYDTTQNLCTLKGAAINDHNSAGIKNAYSYDTYDKTEIIGTPMHDSMVPTTLENCQRLCTNNADCDAYNYRGTLCYLRTTDNKNNTLQSWKLTKPQSSPADPSNDNIMQCCMGHATGTNCGAHTPNGKNCDIFMTEYCKKNPTLIECQCINRKNNHQYNKVKNELTKRAGENIQDDCWYTPCKMGSKSYIPSDMTPLTVTYYDQDQLTKIDNLRCVGSKSCDIKDMYNPDLVNNCTGLRLSGNVQMSPINIVNNTNMNSNGPTIPMTPTSPYIGPNGPVAPMVVSNGPVAPMVVSNGPAPMVVSNGPVAPMAPNYSISPISPSGPMFPPAAPSNISGNTTSQGTYSSNGVIWDGQIVSSGGNTANVITLKGQTITQPISVVQTPGTNQVIAGPAAPTINQNYMPGFPIGTHPATLSPMSPPNTNINTSNMTTSSSTIKSSNTNSAPNINSSQSIMEQFDRLEGFDTENTSQYSSYNPNASYNPNVNYDANTNYNQNVSYIPNTNYNTGRTNESLWDRIKETGEEVYDKIKDVGEDIYDKIRNTTSRSYQDVTQFGDRVWDDVRGEYRDIRDDVRRDYNEVRNDISNEYNTVRADASQDFNEAKQDIRTDYGDIRSDIRRGYNNFINDIRSVNIQDFYASGPGSVMLRSAMQNPNLNTTVEDLSRYDLQRPGQPVTNRTNIIDYNSLVLLVVLLIIFIAWRFFAKR